MHVCYYYAIASGVLSGDSITATVSVAATVRIDIIAISGANIISPFDPNLATAPSANATSGTTATVTFSTTNPDDVIISTAKSDVSPDYLTGGASGYTTFLCCGTSSTYHGLQYQIVSATGSYTPSFTLGGSTDWAIIGDAIQAT
jgi:hypothetical protein